MAADIFRYILEISTICPLTEVRAPSPFCQPWIVYAFGRFAAEHKGIEWIQAVQEVS